MTSTTAHLPALFLDLDDLGDLDDPATLRCELWCAGDAAPAIATLPVSPDLRLPFDSASLATVVVAGALARLDAPDAYGLILDCHRVLAAGGSLAVGLPDTDAALAAWRRGDARTAATAATAAIAGLAGSADDERQTWPGRGVPDTLDTRMAAAICSYRSARPPAYVGPPVLDPPALRGLLERWSPFRLAVELRHAVLETEPRFQLGRCSAWGRDELAADLGRTGFVIAGLGRDAAAALLARLPRPTPIGAGDLWCLAHPAMPASRRGLSARDELREGQQALAQNAGSAKRHYRLLWARFGRAVEEAALAPASEPGFRARGYFLGQLPWDALREFDACLAHAGRLRLAVDDFAPGYSHNDALSAEAADGFNACSIYLELGPEQRRRLAPVLQALAVPVRACLGTGFRVVNMRCWRTPTGPRLEEAQTWHKDELYPRETLKAMIYLSPVGPAFGSTELALAGGARVIPEGPPGTVLLFRNSVLTHRGVPPRGRERTVLEFTLAPWPEDDLRPRFAGLNAEFPVLPWDPLDGL